MNQTSVHKENKMGVMPVNKLLLSMSLPMMVSMLVQALYNIVDSMFVARINENALTAVSLAFPIQMLLTAFGVGTGVGVNALLSRSLGEKDFKTANRAAANGLFLSVVTYLVFLVVGLFIARPFYLSQTKDEQIVEYGVQYLSIVCIFSIGMLLQMMLEKLLQSTGKTMFTMITQSTGAVINIVFDPILIFGLFGFPKMGIAGAAAATIFGQCVSCVMAIIFNLKFNREISLNLKGFKPDLQIIGKIYAVGLPSIVMQAIGSVMNYGMNRILIGFSSTATAVFGVYYKVQSFVFMPVFGLNNGMVPIIAYNYGAGKKDRVIRTVRLSVMYAVLIMAAGVAVFQLAPKFLLGLFAASDHMLEIGVPALRIISLSFLFAAFGIVSSSFFQALGNGVYSMFVSLTRQLIVLLPVAFLLSMTGNVQMVWFAFPIAEIFSFALSIFFTVRITKKVVNHIGEQE
ncbi:MAG: MATE family efflux transporter [Lachnospiraceae bacterium]|nr:MATE family efflux transporter [Lachnospiraceae bacterium]